MCLKGVIFAKYQLEIKFRDIDERNLLVVLWNRASLYRF